MQSEKAQGATIPASNSATAHPHRSRSPSRSPSKKTVTLRDNVATRATDPRIEARRRASAKQSTRDSKPDLAQPRELSQEDQLGQLFTDFITASFRAFQDQQQYEDQDERLAAALETEDTYRHTVADFPHLLVQATRLLSEARRDVEKACNDAGKSKAKAETATVNLSKHLLCAVAKPPFITKSLLLEKDKSKLEQTQSTATPQNSKALPGDSLESPIGDVKYDPELRIRGLKDGLEILRKDNVQLLNKSMTLELAVESLKQQNLSYNRRLEELEASRNPSHAIPQLTSINPHYAERVDNLEVQFNSRINKLDETTRKFIQKYEDRQTNQEQQKQGVKDSSTMQADVQELFSQTVSLRQDLTKMQNSTNEIKDLRTDLLSVSGQHQSLDATVKAMKAARALEQKPKESDNLTAQVKSLNEKITKLGSDRELKVNPDDFKSVQGQVAELKASFSDPEWVQQSISQIADRVVLLKEATFAAHLEPYVKSFSSFKSDIQTKLTICEAQIGTFSRTLEQLAKDIDASKLETSKQNDLHWKEFSHNLAQLRGSFDHTHSTLREVQAATTKLSEDCKIALSNPAVKPAVPTFKDFDPEAVSHQLKQLHSAYERNDHSLRSLHARYNNLTTEGLALQILGTLDRTNDQNRQLIADTQTAVINLRAEYDNIVTQSAKRDHQLNALEKKLFELSKQVPQLATQSTGPGKEYQTLQAQVAANEQTLSHKISASSQAQEKSLTATAESIRKDHSNDEERLWQGIQGLEKDFSQLKEDVTKLRERFDKEINKCVSLDDIGDNVLQSFMKPRLAKLRSAGSTESHSRTPSVASERIPPPRRLVDRIWGDDTVTVATPRDRQHLKDREHTPAKRRRSPSSSQTDEAERRGRGMPKKTHPSPSTAEKAK